MIVTYKGTKIVDGKCVGRAAAGYPDGGRRRRSCSAVFDRNRREIWDQVGPRAEQAMRGNEGTYDKALLLIMERHGYQGVAIEAMK